MVTWMIWSVEFTIAIGSCNCSDHFHRIWIFKYIYIYKQSICSLHQLFRRLFACILFELFGIENIAPWRCFCVDWRHEWLSKICSTLLAPRCAEVNEICTQFWFDHYCVHQNWPPYISFFMLQKPHLISEAYFCSYFQCDLCKT